MGTIAHLSDLHFGRLDEAVAEALVGEMRARPPDLIVISGDLTQRARRAEFAEAARFIGRLPSRPLVVPGNHDLPAGNLGHRVLWPHKRFRKAIERDPFPTFEGAGMRVIGVDTTRVGGLYLDWSRGRISRSQIGVVGEFFGGAGRRDETRVVVTHHPFLYPPGRRERDLVGRAKLALASFRQSGVHLLLAGHFHKAYSGHVAMPHPDEHRIVVAQASTATSTRLKGEPNAYNWITCGGAEIHVLHRVWEPARSGFVDGELREYAGAG
ncbi:metallophosphoesterase [soil metagenome]